MTDPSASALFWLGNAPGRARIVRRLPGARRALDLAARVALLVAHSARSRRPHSQHLAALVERARGAVHGRAGGVRRFSIRWQARSRSRNTWPASASSRHRCSWLGASPAHGVQRRADPVVRAVGVLRVPAGAAPGRSRMRRAVRRDRGAAAPGWPMGSHRTARDSWRTCRSSRRSGCRWRCSPCTRIWTMGRRRWLAVFACAWLVQALSNGYYLLFFPVLIALWLAWFVDWTREYARGLALAAAWVVASLPLVPVLLQVRRRPPRARPGAHAGGDDDLQRQGRRRSFTPPACSRSGRPTPTDTTEVYLFPGVTPIALVIAGWRRAGRASGGRRVRRRAARRSCSMRPPPRSCGRSRSGPRPRTRRVPGCTPTPCWPGCRVQFAPRAGEVRDARHAVPRDRGRSRRLARAAAAARASDPRRGAGHRRAGRRRLDAVDAARRTSGPGDPARRPGRARPRASGQRRRDRHGGDVSVDAARPADRQRLQRSHPAALRDPVSRAAPAGSQRVHGARARAAARHQREPQLRSRRPPPAARARDSRNPAAWQLEWRGVVRAPRASRPLAWRRSAMPGR